MLFILDDVLVMGETRDSQDVFADGRQQNIRAKQDEHVRKKNVVHF